MGKPAETTVRKQPPGKPFKPGQSGNPNGRPKGSRNKLGEEFLKDVLDIWERRGMACLEEMATDKPNEFVRVVAMVLPKDINVTGDIKHTHVEESVSDTLEWLAEAIKSNTEAKKPMLN